MALENLGTGHLACLSKGPFACSLKAGKFFPLVVDRRDVVVQMKEETAHCRPNERAVALLLQLLAILRSAIGVHEPFSREEMRGSNRAVFLWIK